MSNNRKELQMADAKRAVFVADEVIEVKTGEGPPQKFTYDHVFSEEDDQSVVFENVARPVVQDIMSGYNATIFAYGQTSSGKTYTMEGASIDDPELRGIIPRTATEIFNNVMAADENIEFIVKVSYIEIYMERIRDLLDPYKSKVNLQVREDVQRGIFVEGMTEVCVTSDDELLSTMRDGAANRAVAATGMNEGSSRSHSVFMVTLYQRNLVNQATKAGKLYLVDLAGSEMVRKTGASGRQLEEAKTINKSLSALGMVINALTDPNSHHVPYRDSKLTRVLQESLGGNSRTNLIINVSPSSYNTSETLSTLRFGNRAKSIKNKAVVNEQRSVEEYKLLLAKAEKALAMQQNYIISLEARLSSNNGGDSSVAAAIPRPDIALEQSGDSAMAVATGAESSNDGIGIADLSLDLTGTSTQSGTEEPGSAHSPSTRAARAVEELQEKIAQLEDELAEEKQESMRRGEEIRLLTAKVEEQAHALETSKTVIDEVQKVKELLEKSNEERLRQRETLYSELKADYERLSFEHKELAIHAETVQSEYDSLLQELPPTSANSPGKLASAIVAADAAEKQKAEEAQTSDAGGASTEGEQPAESTSPATALEENAAVAEGEETSSHGEDPSPLSPAAGESAEESFDLKAKCAALEAELKEYEREYRQLQASTEREKGRLLEDLERKKAQIRELELQLDRATHASGASSPSSGGGSGMSARERQHMRSIQQKLEQLVAVHRQLLRKYASLELELSEAKKKLVLRDERIKQVEANNRIMAGNMRAQAEKHVEELTHLRDQIADFRGAQRSHFEAQMNKSNDANVIKTLRGGSFYNDGVIRPIRGGGRRQTTLMGGGGAGGAPAGTETAPNSGFLNRLFGKGS
uniref:Kinesin-like protein n=1 Tax=Globisporangium ultimum (strain ATCC 200006 / CBS 805.95 / DAOM BR144) TaxID=431595 RepID=K3WTP4_GLOUD